MTIKKSRILNLNDYDHKPNVTFQLQFLQFWCSYYSALSFVKIPNLIRLLGTRWIACHDKDWKIDNKLFSKFYFQAAAKSSVFQAKVYVYS